MLKHMDRNSEINEIIMKLTQSYLFCNYVLILLEKYGYNLKLS